MGNPAGMAGKKRRAPGRENRRTHKVPALTIGPLTTHALRCEMKNSPTPWIDSTNTRTKLIEISPCSA